MYRSACSMIVFVTLATNVASVAAQQPEVRASNGWVAEPPPGSTAAPAYVDITNPGMYDIYIVTATSDVAGKVEFREVAGTESKPVKEITVPAYGATSLKPAGTSMLLMDLKRPLKAGEKIPLTLTTDGNLLLTVEAEVRKPQP